MKLNEQLLMEHLALYKVFRAMLYQHEIPEIFEEKSREDELREKLMQEEKRLNDYLSDPYNSEDVRKLRYIHMNENAYQNAIKEHENRVQSMKDKIESLKEQLQTYDSRRQLFDYVSLYL